MAVPLPTLKARFFDANGDPLSGGKLFSYIAGTSTPLGTYSDVDGEASNTNPVILDANGEADIYIGSGTYKFTLKDSADVVQWTVDDIVSTASAVTPSGWSEHAITDAQSATDLTGETLDLTLYSSAHYYCEVIRGTTIIANGMLYLENLNGTAQASVGVFSTNSGVTFTASTAASVGQLRAACSTGPGNGTIKLSRRLVPV